MLAVTLKIYVTANVEPEHWVQPAVESVREFAQVLESNSENRISCVIEEHEGD